ncbi:MAG: aminoglycoside phosphotransferase [Candidatus Nomurabacteria bacterium]|nr:aminoglycoside phosphotransferase [Candidatus Nomurabacteria bacterium]
MEEDKFTEIIGWAKEQLHEEVSVSKETHGDRSDVFILSTSDKKYFLKVGNDLKKEYERLVWLEGRLPVPKVIAFKNFDGREALLISGMNGKNLKVLSKEWPVEKVVDKLAGAIRAFHSMKSSQFPLGNPKDGDVFIHGDASLPNFIFEGDKFSGYIDLGDMTTGEKETDFAAAIWSLQYNLGKGYGKMFLEKYGVTDVTEEMVERLRLKYEDMQEAWGL